MGIASVTRVNVRLRDIEDADLDELFEFERDPRAVAVAAFTRADPSDRAAFDAHYQRIRNDRELAVRAIEVDGAFTGTIASFPMEGQREVSYWIDPARWGQGLASAALRAFLQVEVTRPLFARVAEHNVGSAKVLTRAGFVRIDSETSYAEGVGRDVIEHIYRLSA
jgi:RimJ/RimL family protein N-acetyltransferase